MRNELRILVVVAQCLFVSARSNVRLFSLRPLNKENKTCDIESMRRQMFMGNALSTALVNLPKCRNRLERDKEPQRQSIKNEPHWRINNVALYKY